jgi:hypothetical protein
MIRFLGAPTGDIMNEDITPDGIGQELRDWFAKEKAEHGLEDIKFYPADSNGTLIAHAAREILTVAKADKSKYIDITNEHI